MWKDLVRRVGTNTCPVSESYLWPGLVHLRKRCSRKSEVVYAELYV
jgi:hypothetical protein